MFKIVPFLTIAIAVIFILIAALSFSKNWRNLLKTALIIAGIFGVSFFYTRYINKLNNQFIPMTSTSMFKKLEYVEKLKLVSFYSEEVIVLGTKEKVQKRVDKLTQDSVALAEKKIKAENNLNEILKKIEETTNSQYENQEQITKSAEQLNRLYKSYKELKQVSIKDKVLWKDEHRMLNDASTYKYWEIYKYKYDSLLLNFNTKPWKSGNKKRKEYKEELEQWKERFIQTKANLASRLQAKVALKENHYQNLKRENKKKESIFKTQKKEALTTIDKARKQWEKTVEKLQKTTYKLQEARVELAFAKEKNIDIEPEILIVVPAEVSSYIDMAAIKIRKDESDTVHILLPTIQMDSVIIELKDDAIYDLDKKEKEWMATQQGAYFDIFGQLKDALLEKEQLIKEKAQENGILTQGEEMAKSYLQNFIEPLGYEVIFEKEKMTLNSNE